MHLGSPRSGIHGSLAGLKSTRKAQPGLKDRRRIIRALEIYLLTGQQPSVIQRHAGQANLFQPIIFALQPAPGPNCMQRLMPERVHDQAAGPGGREYIELHRKRGYSPQSNAMQGLGYRHCNLYLKANGPWRKWSHTSSRIPAATPRGN